jgi:CubicO group peptidase (beta-lactamase class C family)
MKTIMFLFMALIISSCNSSNSNESSAPGQSIKALQQKNGLPGFGAASLVNGELEVTTSGVRRIEFPTPLISTNSFHLGSCSKAMTATLAAILIEEGYLDWNSKLTDLLLDITLHTDFQNLTFEMLLAHRSGIVQDGAVSFPNDWLFKALQNPAMSTVDAKLLYSKSVLSLKPQSIPGSKFNYHNGGYMIAAHIMEQLTGQSWESLMQEKLFDPLEMLTCGTGPTWGHYRNDSGIHSVKADNPPGYSPAAGIHCSLEDWGKFLTQHLQKSGIVTAASFSKLHTVAANDGSNYTYGGWIKVQLPWTSGYVLTHNGSNSLNYAQVWIAPNQNSIFMFGSNIAGDEAVNAINDGLASLIRQKL